MFLDVDADEWAFLDEIQIRPDDETARLIYADWLESRGDPRADYLRIELWLPRLEKGGEDYLDAQRRLRDLGGRINPAWIAHVARAPIENCERQKPRFKLRCPQKWEQLRPTYEPGVRHCDVCNQKVHFCHSVRVAVEHAAHGRCVALDAGVERTEGDLQDDEVMVGLVDFIDPTVVIEPAGDPAGSGHSSRRWQPPRRTPQSGV